MSGITRWWLMRSKEIRTQKRFHLRQEIDYAAIITRTTSPCPWDAWGWAEPEGLPHCCWWTHSVLKPAEVIFLCLMSHNWLRNEQWPVWFHFGLKWSELLEILMQGMYPAFVKNLRVRGREGRERERETDRQTYRQAGRQTDRKKVKQTICTIILVLLT